MVNHSCDPNCALVFDGRKLQVRTVKDVKEGEEVLKTRMFIFSGFAAQDKKKLPRRFKRKFADCCYIVRPRKNETEHYRCFIIT